MAYVGCLALLVTTLSHYGLQTADMNISLSAIALMWTIVDFLSQDSPKGEGDAHAYVVLSRGACIYAFVCAGRVPSQRRLSSGSLYSER